jgi:hypothetical protein
MSQHDYNIANADGATVRADINSVLEALASQNAGATAPPVTFQFIPWFDTSTSLLKIRNSSNTDWVTIASLSAGVWIPYRSGSAIPAWGTSIGNLVQLIDAGGNAALPAVSGENLTGLPLIVPVNFGDGDVNLASGATVYIGLGQSSASDVMLVVIPQGGVVYGLRVVTTGSPGSGQNYVFTVHKNQVATSLTGTISNTSTTVYDDTNSFSVVAGDVLSLKAVASASADNTGGVFAAVVVAVQ